MPCVVNGLADESEEVRGTSMAAARKIVDFYATTSTPLLLPVLEVIPRPCPVVVLACCPDNRPGICHWKHLQVAI